MAENFKIIEKKENPLFNRREVQISIEAGITPSHTDAQKLISEKFSVPTENIRVKNILGKFGSKTFVISANVYASKQDKESVEKKSKKDAGSVKKEEPKSEEKPAEEEKPIEEVKKEQPTKEKNKEEGIEKPDKEEQHA